VPNSIIKKKFYCNTKNVSGGDRDWGYYNAGEIQIHYNTLGARRWKSIRGQQALRNTKGYRRQAQSLTEE